MSNLTIKEVGTSIRKSSYAKMTEYHYRYLPESILHMAMSDFLIYENAPQTLEYILNAFYIYRDAANMDIFVPHVLVNGAYQWLDSASFEWLDIKQVISIGQSIHNCNSYNSHALLYNFEEAREYSVLFSMEWQNESLRKYARPISKTLLDFKDRRITPEKIGGTIFYFLESLDDNMVID